MFIFYLSEDPKEAAQYHVDKHVVKMIVESAQMLCTAHRLLDSNQSDILYKTTHKNHPCAIWCRESVQNYNWLYRLFVSLCDEYTFRYGKTHLTDRKLRNILSNPPKNIKDVGPTLIAQAMPQELKQENPVSAYRQYYIKEKTRFAFWTKRDKPIWFNNNDLQ